MQEQGRGEPARDQIAPVNDLIEGVQLAGVVEAGKDKGSETENIKMPGFIGAAAAEINKQADGEIDSADQILPGNRRSRAALRGW